MEAARLGQGIFTEHLLGAPLGTGDAAANETKPPPSWGAHLVCLGRNK